MSDEYSRLMRHRHGPVLRKYTHNPYPAFNVTETTCSELNDNTAHNLLRIRAFEVMNEMCKLDTKGLSLREVETLLVSFHKQWKAAWDIIFGIAH